uniref:TLDc domain-containing protein n=1 Tax=Arundo donax TaxID=35708 RepID=A0A0A8YF39_ARUDO
MALMASGRAMAPTRPSFVTPRSFFNWGKGARDAEKPPPPQLHFQYHNVELPFSMSLVANTHLRDRELKCCYKATVDGFSATDFHRRCDFKGPCVVVGHTAGSFRFGGFSPEGYRSTDDYYDTLDAFLFYWPEPPPASGKATDPPPPVVLPKVGGSGAALFDYARGGPQFGADGLLIGPPLTAVMGVFTGPDASAGVGDLRSARSRLGLSYARRADGKESLFGDEPRAELAEVLVFCSPQIASLY